MVEILRDVAEAIDYAHSRGVLHRDVKPQNILLDEAGHAYLADFGIARIVAGGDEATQTGAVMGTPKYMSPEQARGDRVDHRCDVYSLGIVAYEMLTGKAPFSGSTPMNIAVKHIMDAVPPPDPGLLAPPLAAPVLKCLAKQPDERYDSAGAFVEALEAGLRQVVAAAPAPTPPAPVSPPPPQATRPPRARERTPTRPAASRRPARGTALQTRALMVAVSLVALGGLAALAWLRPSKPPSPATSPEPTPPPAPTTVPEAAASAPGDDAAPASTAPPPRLTSAATMELFERVCDEGEAASCERLALAYLEEGRDASDRARAPDLFARACEGGAAGACLTLARLYGSGEGVLRNLARAVALYDQACQGGEVRGCHELGLLYRSGRGVSADAARARELLQGACDAGLAEACADVDPPSN